MTQKHNIPVPRGIRNNNPLNIRIGNTWLGEVSAPTDTQFEQFCHMKYGLRAAFCILRRYIRKYHRNTIAQIITSWSPASENDVQSYIDTVCNKTGLNPDDVIDYADKKTMVKLVAAMAFVECGRPIDTRLIEEGYDIA